jgi:signal peptidase II
MSRTLRQISDPLAGALRGKQPYLLLSLGILVLVQWSKWLVESRLEGAPPVDVIPGLLNLTHVRNTGVAFGLFPAGGSLVGMVLLSILGFAGFSLLSYYFLNTPRHQRLLLGSLALVLGGAVGNLLDRVASGAVTDFIDLHFRGYHWYTFNVADSAITAGIALMTLELFLPSRPAVTEECRGDSVSGATGAASRSPELP